MIELTFERTPVIRLAISPSWELLQYVSAVQQGRHAAVSDERMAAWTRTIAGESFEALRAAVSDPGYVPDFLVPAPEEPLGDLRRDLDRIRGASLDRIADGVAPLGPLGPEGFVRPERFRDAAIAQMEAFWRLVVAPVWPEHRAMLERDILTRGREAVLRGSAALLGRLHTDVSWADDRLTVQCDAVDLELTCGGELLLVPSVFAWPKVFVGPPDGEGRAVVYYPARGAGSLFTDAGRASGDRRRDGAAMQPLLGASRARILVELRRPATTTGLARQLGLSNATVSQHLQVLARSGLVARTRIGRHVYYEWTPRGRRLVELFGRD